MLRSTITAGSPRSKFIELFRDILQGSCYEIHRQQSDGCQSSHGNSWTNITAGGNSSAAGIGILIQATNLTTYGKLVVNDGVTLTLKGYDRTGNAAM